ncbi:MAG: hypothetical protein IJS62_08270 [Bacteroidales bacterium]|nr:hypothetical protein [Bacteroidales bacterium]
MKIFAVDSAANDEISAQVFFTMTRKVSSYTAPDSFVFSNFPASILCASFVGEAPELTEGDSGDLIWI